MRYNKLEKLFKLALDINGSIEYQYNDDTLVEAIEVECEKYKCQQQFKIDPLFD